ncbi:MAG: alpha/beta hydrolase-fold protein [Bacteroidota bacterium]
MTKHLVLLTTTLLLLFSIADLLAQQDTSLFPLKKHLIQSEHLQEQREYWVSLPLQYNPATSYPVLYVLDAEWRVDLIGRLAYDLGGNLKMPRHIIIGIPHVEWGKKRGIDLTFSHSRMEYDGEAVDSTWYNATNSGGAEKFYRYLVEELIPSVNTNYQTTGSNTLIGHSYGGYFGAYILSRDNPFTAYHLYDPSIWFSEGEAIEQIEQQLSEEKKLQVFISLQAIPAYHAGKIMELIEVLSNYKNIDLGYKLYPDETHNSLFIPSFLDAIKFQFNP